MAGSVGGSVASVTGGVTLIAAYDAAKSAASQASVSAIPTNPLLTTDVRLNNLDAQVSTRLATSGYTAPPATVTLAASQPNYAPAKTTDIATLATQTSVNTIDTKITAIKAQTDQFSFATGKVNANATATVDTAAIDAALAAPGSAMSIAHGSGSWLTGSGGGGSSIVIPVITGQPTLIRLTDSVSLQILRGDSYRVTFSLGSNYTGYTGQFAAKLRGADGSLSPTYSIPLRSIVWTDATIGAGYVDLTAADTAVIGLYTGEIQLTDGTHVRTPKQYTIGITADIIT